MTPSILTRALPCLVLLTTLAACSTPVPDHRIRLMPSADGKHMNAVPPDCMSWSEYDLGYPYENHPWPQYGCAQARNLAAAVERPEDLISGNELGKANAITSTSAQSRYLAGKQTNLINPHEDKPVPIIKMDDNRLGGGQPKE